jgi:nuclear transcription Y subunit beta
MSDDGKKGEKTGNEFDRFLPIANIGRIIKTNLPKEVKLSKDAKETFQECLSEFISFITSEASEKCKNEKRKTINGDDIIFALNNLGFEHYNQTLKTYLQKYRASQKTLVDKNNGEGNNPPGSQDENEEDEDDKNTIQDY